MFVVGHAPVRLMPSAGQRVDVVCGHPKSNRGARTSRIRWSSIVKKCAFLERCNTIFDFQKIFTTDQSRSSDTWAHSITITICKNGRPIHRLRDHEHLIPKYLLANEIQSPIWHPWKALDSAVYDNRRQSVITCGAIAF